MEFYKTFKNLVSKAPKALAIGIVASLPYVCESCGVIGAIPYNGSEIKQEIVEKDSILEKEVLETILRK